MSALLPSVGVELELLAPPGRTRRDVAEAIAQAHDAEVVPVFHRDTEPSLVPGTPVFANLSVGFEVRKDGRWLARCVDDLTLQDDLERTAAPKPGWWRVVSDDRRLLHLASRHGRADAGLAEVMGPLAALFGTTVESVGQGVLRVRDPEGAPVALGAPLPGERERVCELVTAPIHGDLRAGLEQVLAPVADLGLRVAAESATHLHVDGAAFQDARVFARLVRRWLAEGDALKAEVGTNPRCRRLGGWPPALVDTVSRPGFTELPWERAQAVLQSLQLSKYVDLNVKGIVYDLRHKRTVEMRVLPGAATVDEVLALASPALAFFDRVLRG